jgi:hypothetical protein
MPRLSLYRPEKSNDYEFLDKVILEQFSIGGTDIYLHKYLGPKNPQTGQATADQPTYDTLDPLNIQDLLFLENRDREYDQDIYRIRGIYNLQDNDFNLSQFGLFLSNDIVFMTVHINSTVKTLGRKIISGDVIELPHLADEYALNGYNFALKRFYVVEEVTRASEGFSQTWYPHLYRLKLKQLVPSQEYQDILDKPAGENTDTTIGDLLSTYNKEIEINDAVIAQAEADAGLSGYNTSHFYTLQVDENGKAELVTADLTNLDASASSEFADRINQTPEREGYSGYLLGDGFAPNGEAFGSGITFPRSAVKGDYYLRTDFMPNRLFRFDGGRWVKVEDNVRHTLTNSATRKNQKGTFINNTNTDTICGDTIDERQSLSKALRPRADN